MIRTIQYLTDDTSWFPDPRGALRDPPGLVAVGGDLQPERIYQAYLNGIFPWYSKGEPLMWWSPDPRATFDVDHIRVNKSLKKFLKKCDYDVTLNTQFQKVIEGCAQPRGNGEGTWILPEMIHAYTSLHQQGLAHSIEIWQWQDGRRVLIGGLYGVLVGSCFCGESMFSNQPNASKLALIVLAQLLKSEPYAMIDCQLPNPYLQQMGAYLMSRKVFLSQLERCKQQVPSVDLFKPKFIDWRSNLL